MGQIVFSGFSDEAAVDIDNQILALKESGLGGMDVRTVNGVNVLELSRDILKEVKSKGTESGLRIQCIGSPVNKVEFASTKPVDEQERLKGAIEAAHQLETKRIRIFSPAAPWEDRESVLEWMAAMVEMAKSADVVLLHENDGTYFGAYPDQEKWLFDHLGGPHFKAAFDFSNAVMIGFDPVQDFLPWIMPHLDTLHMKDYSISKKQVVACGEGDSKMSQFLAEAHRQGWQGTFTLEPHLLVAGAQSGWTGLELFCDASRKMKELVGACFEVDSVQRI